MALLCYNKGCGEKYDADKNKDDSCVFHPGVPIFHDALKGWSCCKKRTTDFSEFLSIKGCTRGRHSNEKPQEPLRPEVVSDKGEIKHTNGQEIIYQGPKSAEKLKKERPSSDEPMTKLPQKVSASLAQVLEKLEISKKAEKDQKDSEVVIQGTRCKNSGCKTAYQGPETDMEVCTHHPGAPVFHEGYKYWSCCCIRTIDFNAFLDQKGCTTGKHRWVPKQDKKKVACRHDWHQTGNNVVVTIYAKNANPELSCIEANRTVLSCQIQFENNKIFKREFHMWGVINVKQSSVNMVPSKVEISLRKADQVAWGKLEDPNYKPEPEPVEDSLAETNESHQPDWDIADDDISDSDEEWAYDTPENKQKEKREEQRKAEDMQNLQRKEVEEEMKRAMEERRKAEEEKKRLEEQRREEEAEGFEDMPDLE
ncbi:cysteine and histidine-rich domain-containing protein 1-like [Seriola lalandi dorsalis]|uniref:cysteine and histidine-rich domain-containing protein 1-like n=1 Tax=Seriola lalandi dorsalis TaxID=1841481 RepID=UPI000C6FB772|nr:cysteine and histidine-rich domain-containing protein 1-like [Seriola lalandi dorsalis]XP_056224395.1 cysteine and histidine-rich domain-containing protein 1 [Seriola aureovittata]